jgi:hypothetical protein
MHLRLFSRDVLPTHIALGGVTPQSELGAELNQLLPVMFGR